MNAGAQTVSPQDKARRTGWLLHKPANKKKASQRVTMSKHAVCCYPEVNVSRTQTQTQVKDKIKCSDKMLSPKKLSFFLNHQKLDHSCSDV